MSVGARKLDGKRGVEHVGTGHALMHEARFGADLLGDPVEEGDNVVLGDCLNGVDRGDVDTPVPLAHQSHSALPALSGTTPSSPILTAACASISNQMR